MAKMSNSRGANPRFPAQRLGMTHSTEIHMGLHADPLLINSHGETFYRRVGEEGGRNETEIYENTKIE